MTDTAVADRDQSSDRFKPTVTNICGELDRIEARIEEIDAGAPSLGDDEMEFLLCAVNDRWRRLADIPSKDLDEIKQKAKRLAALAYNADDDGYTADGLVPPLAASLAADVTELAVAA